MFVEIYIVNSERYDYLNLMYLIVYILNLIKLNSI